MAKALVALALVLSLLTQPALAGRGASSSAGARGAKVAEGQKSKAANNTATCKRYFAVIGEVVSVPC